MFLLCSNGFQRMPQESSVKKKNLFLLNPLARQRSQLNYSKEGKKLESGTAKGYMPGSEG
jgi:hypothetical protein